MANLKYKKNKNVDHIFDKKEKEFIALRKVAWGKGEEKVDLRRWHLDMNDNESPGKGFTLSEDATHELTLALVKEEYGDTKEILTELKNRDDFSSSLKEVLDDKELKTIEEDTEDEDFYDPDELIM